MTFLLLTVYPAGSDLHRSDQITVPADIWTLFDQRHHNHTPIFVELETGVVGRLRPAVPSDGLYADHCRVPEWMWLRLGAPVDFWVQLNAIVLPMAAGLRLRPHNAVGESEDILSLELSGSGAGPSWACLSVGMLLPLSCGDFDVVDITDDDGVSLSAACILDRDVMLEYDIPTPTAVTPTASSPVAVAPQTQVNSGGGMLPSSLFRSTPSAFRGTGRRLNE